MQHTTVAVDLAKSVFQVAISRRPGRVSERKRLSRPGFQRFIAQLEPAHVVMEACGSSHYWGRVLQARGHTVTLLPPQHVRRYRIGNKTDDTDAKALLEAVRNEEICPVPVKSVEQQTLIALHRLRVASMDTRIARINLLRGVLREFGITIPVGPRYATAHVQCWLLRAKQRKPTALFHLFRSGHWGSSAGAVITSRPWLWRTSLLALSG